MYQAPLHRPISEKAYHVKPLSEVRWPHLDLKRKKHQPTVLMFFSQKKLLFLQILLLHVLLSLEASEGWNTWFSSNPEKKNTPKTTQPTHHTALRHYVFPDVPTWHIHFFPMGGGISGNPVDPLWWWNTSELRIQLFWVLLVWSDSLDASNSNENHSHLELRMLGPGMVWGVGKVLDIYLQKQRKQTIQKLIFLWFLVMKVVLSWA